MTRQRDGTDYARASGGNSYETMLVTVRDRVQKMKTAGRAEKEVVAAKPAADFDAAWGAGLIQPDAFFARAAFSALVIGEIVDPCSAED